MNEKWLAVAKKALDEFRQKRPLLIEAGKAREEIDAIVLDFEETAGQTMSRLKAHAVILAAVPGTPKVRRVKKERRHRRRDGGVRRLSSISA